MRNHSSLPLSAFAILAVFAILAGLAQAETPPPAASGNCWSDASAYYGIPVEALVAIAKVESGMNPAAVGKNDNGSRDIGLMQINTNTMNEWRKRGVQFTEADAKEPCKAIWHAAWLLAENKQRLGWNWSAIGAYNVGCKKLSKDECERRRNIYAWRVYRAMTGTKAAKTAPVASAARKEPSIMSVQVAAEPKLEATDG